MAGTSDESAIFERLAESAPSPDDRVLHALEAEFAARPTGVRSWPRRSRLGVSLLLLVLALAVTSLGSLAGAEFPLVLLASGSSLALGVFLLPASVPGVTRLRLRPRQLLLVAILLSTIAYVAWNTSAFAPLASLTQGDPWARVVACGLHVLVTGGLCLAALLLPWRRSDPFSPTLLGASLGAFAGLSGMLSVDAGCRSSEGFHVLFGHASAVVLFGLLGALLGRRWLSP